MLSVLQEEYSLSSFFKGYTEGKLDLSGWPQMLKLNDWPPSGSFEDHLPRHNVEFLAIQGVHTSTERLLEPCYQVT